MEKEKRTYQHRDRLLGILPYEVLVKGSGRGDEGVEWLIR